jgi:hypothetical protein
VLLHALSFKTSRQLDGDPGFGWWPREVTPGREALAWPGGHHRIGSG